MVVYVQLVLCPRRNSSS